MFQPGCSSVGELLSENGPFVWQPGTFQPIRNKWAWTELTNVVWIDQPVGTGFSQGTVTARNEQDVAKQFLGFWRNFVTTFEMQGYSVYITGSSYSGMYCPYIASAMLDANDKTFFNVSGMQIFDGIYSSGPLAEDVTVAKFVDSWGTSFGFNDSFRSAVANASQTCGYNQYMQTHLTFPPTGKQPAQLPGQGANGSYTPGCALWNGVLSAAVETNACFSPYSVDVGCPQQYDPLGFSNGQVILYPGSGPAFFNREDVKRAINAPPNTTWEFCTSRNVFVDGVDESLDAGPGSQPVLPGIIERTNNVIIGHGVLDFVLMSDGTLLSIQNLTWGGAQGFQTRPTGPLYVPYHDNSDFLTLAGAGVQGTAHTERGLTFFAVATAGHFLAMDAPAVAFRSVEVLLRRVEGFQSMAPFTTDANRTQQLVQSVADMGMGTVLIGNGVQGQCARGEAAGSVAGLAAATTSAGARSGLHAWSAAGGGIMLACTAALLM
jgi:carboxypeptidase D